jgi:predicted GTPase
MQQAVQRWQLDACMPGVRAITLKGLHVRNWDSEASDRQINTRQHDAKRQAYLTKLLQHIPPRTAHAALLRWHFSSSSSMLLQLLQALQTASVPHPAAVHVFQCRLRPKLQA